MQRSYWEKWSSKEIDGEEVKLLCLTSPLLILFLKNKQPPIIYYAH